MFQGDATLAEYLRLVVYDFRCVINCPPSPPGAVSYLGCFAWFLPNASVYLVELSFQTHIARGIQRTIIDGWKIWYLIAFSIHRRGTKQKLDCWADKSQLALYSNRHSWKNFCFSSKAQTRRTQEAMNFATKITIVFTLIYLCELSYARKGESTSSNSLSMLDFIG